MNQLNFNSLDQVHETLKNFKDSYQEQLKQCKLSIVPQNLIQLVGDITNDIKNKQKAIDKIENLLSNVQFSNQDFIQATRMLNKHLNILQSQVSDFTNPGQFQFVQQELKNIYSQTETIETLIINRSIETAQKKKPVMEKRKTNQIGKQSKRKKVKQESESKENCNLNSHILQDLVNKDAQRILRNRLSFQNNETKQDQNQQKHQDDEDHQNTQLEQEKNEMIVEESNKAEQKKEEFVNLVEDENQQESEIKVLISQEIIQQVANEGYEDQQEMDENSQNEDEDEEDEDEYILEEEDEDEKDEDFVIEEKVRGQKKRQMKGGKQLKKIKEMEKADKVQNYIASMFDF